MIDEGAIYLSTWPMICKLVDKFRRSNKELDRYELRGEAAIFTLKAIRSFKPDKGMKISSWIYRVVQQKLEQRAQWATWRQRMAKSTYVEGEERHNHPYPGYVQSLTFQVSEEAKSAILLATHTGMRKRELSKTLLQEFGWERSLLKKVFEEIKECL